MGSREKTKIKLNNPKDFEKQNIEKKVLESTPLLEAFGIESSVLHLTILGNAKTLKNDNSSRFGKVLCFLIHRTHNI